MLEIAEPCVLCFILRSPNNTVGKGLGITEFLKSMILQLYLILEYSK